MFLDSPELYDAIYRFKNYAAESRRLRSLIEATVPGAATVLDVACGTGEHAKFLKDYYTVDGVDINEEYLRAARTKNPAGNYTCADMTNFDLGKTYDVVTCLFSAIGNVRTLQALQRAVACMARHVRAGGVLIIEPWFTPDKWNAGGVSVIVGEIGGGKVCRMGVASVEGNLSILQFHYLKGTPAAIEHYSERLELALFTRKDMTHALESVQMQVWYEPEGLIGRGLYIGKQRF